MVRTPFYASRKYMQVPTIQLVKAETKEEGEEEEEVNSAKNLAKQERNNRVRSEGKGIASSLKRRRKCQYPRSTKSHERKESFWLMLHLPKKQRYTPSLYLYIKIYFEHECLQFFHLNSDRL